MKKLNLMLMMLASLSLITLSSCKDDDPTPPPPPTKDITLSVSGGTSVTVTGTDVEKDIIITASEKATKDIVVTVTSNAADGEATIAPAQVIIPEGQLSGKSKITFAATKFPKGTDEKKITVTIVSSAEGVKIGTPTTDFMVKGEGGEELTTLTITANGTEFNTTEEAKDLSVTFTLSKELTEKLPVTITIDPSSSEVFKTMFPEAIPPIEIDANSKTKVIPFTMPKGTEGTLKINFSIANDKVDLKTQTLSATFINDASDPTFSLERTTTGDITVPATGDKAETFKVTLSKASDEAQTITLTAAPEGGVLSVASVAFAASETSKDVTITFQSSVFTSDAVSKDIVVTGASTTLQVGTASITYKVKGTKTTETKIQNLDVAIYNSPSYAVFNTETSFTAICKFGTQKTAGYDAVPVEDFTVTPVITGGVEGVDYKFPKGETADFNIKKGDAWPIKDIIVLPAASGKTITLDFTNAPIKHLRTKKFEIIASTYKKPATPADYKLTFSLTPNGGDMSALAFNHWMVFAFENNTAIPKGTPVYYTYKVTTEDGTDVTSMCQLDMGTILNVSTRYSGYLMVSSGSGDVNIPILKGKKLTVTVNSEDAIIGSNTATFTMKN